MHVYADGDVIARRGVSVDKIPNVIVPERHLNGVIPPSHPECSPALHNFLINRTISPSLPHTPPSPFLLSPSQINLQRKRN